jgi:L-rhamnose-H+ transport protein
MPASAIGLAIIFVSGVLIASFAAPMKLTRAWNWENTWLLYATVGLVLIPCSLVAWTVPHPLSFYSSLPLHTLLPPLLFGFGWGIAQVTFGLSIARVGMAMAFAIVIGLSSLLGSVIPLAVFHPSDLFRRVGAVLLMSAVILFAGLTLYIRADHKRETTRKTSGQGFLTGVLLCVFTGCFGSMINMGFVFGGGIAQQAVREGISAERATLCIWTVVLAAGYIPNLAYTIYLLADHGSIGLFRKSFAREFLIAASSAVLWLFGMLGYGFGADKMGKYGNSIGFAVFMGVTLFWSSALGLFAGEWKTASPLAIRCMRLGLALIIVSMTVLGVSTLIH